MFNLTSQERKTIIFILSILILGIGLDFLKKKTSAYNLIEYETLKEQLFKKVDINRASFFELITIPGLGENSARAIIDYRKSQGGFKDIEELKQIKGIKDKKLEQLRKYIKLSD